MFIINLIFFTIDDPHATEIDGVFESNNFSIYIKVHIYTVITQFVT